MAKKARKKIKARRVKKRITRKKRTVKKKKSVRVRRKKAAAPRKGPALPQEPMGRVTHYFPKARATAVMVERDGIRTGDLLYFKGHTTHFKQKVESLQINRQAVPEASPGEEVGIQVKGRTREHDLVFKL